MTCSIPSCRASAETPLRAVDGIFWFCAAHAVEYAALGYRQVEQDEAEAR